MMKSKKTLTVDRSAGDIICISNLASFPAYIRLPRTLGTHDQAQTSPGTGSLLHPTCLREAGESRGDDCLGL
jgi:hypothetical protein